MEKKQIIHEIIQPTRNLDVYFEFSKDEGSFISSHWHDALEIIYITSGSLQLQIGQLTCQLEKDEFLLINSQVIHSTHCIHGNTAFLLQIPYDFLKRYMPEYDTYYFDLDMNSKNPLYQTKLVQLKQILNEMEAVETDAPEAGNLHFTSLLFELLFLLYHNFRITIGIKQQQGGQSLSWLEPVLEYTKVNYKRPVSIAETAELSHLQPEYFCRKFKQCMGQTYVEYLSEIRLAHIYHDLLHTNSPLYEIIETHGFTNYKLFRRVFYNKFHCTPKEVRRR